MRNALLASGVLGLVVYAVYPCAPPWIGGGDGFTDTVAEGSFVAVARPPGVTNHLGAIPSFHVGWVILAGWVVFRIASSRTLRVLCVLYPALMGYAVISTGNHWVLDIPAGAALAALGLLVATLLVPGPAIPDLTSSHGLAFQGDACATRSRERRTSRAYFTEAEGEGARPARVSSSSCAGVECAICASAAR